MNAERAGDGFGLGAWTGKDGSAGAIDFGAEFQKPCSTPSVEGRSAEGRKEEVGLAEKETGSAGGKLESSSSVSSLARSKFSTTIPRSLNAGGALPTAWGRRSSVMSDLANPPGRVVRWAPAPPCG